VRHETGPQVTLAGGRRQLLQPSPEEDGLTGVGVADPFVEYQGTQEFLSIRPSPATCRE